MKARHAQPVMGFQLTQNRFELQDRQRQAVYAFHRGHAIPPLLLKEAQHFGKGAPVRLANPDDPTERQLIDAVIDCSQLRDIRRIPPVVIVHSPIVNAASVGGQGIFFTTAIVKAMPMDQIRGVVGHELSHHRHSLRDKNIINTLIAGIAIGWTQFRLSARHILLEKAEPLLEKTKSRLLRSVGRDAAHGAGYLLDLAVVATVLTPWRWFMELESDREGAQFVGPKTMAESLETLKAKSTEMKEKKPLTPLQKFGRGVARVLMFFVSPFGSHPPIDWRIRRMHELHRNEILEHAPLVTTPPTGMAHPRPVVQAVAVNQRLAPAPELAAETQRG